MTTGELSTTAEGTDLPESLRATLPGHYYTDPELFRAEQDAIFESTWFCAVRSADLARPGQYETVQIGRESVLVTRGRDGAMTCTPT